MRLRYLSVASALTASLFISSAAFADAAAAAKYVEDAKTEIEQHRYDAAKAKLELADTELEGVAAADKAPVAASIEAAKKQMADASLADNKIKYTRELERVMTDAEGAVGNLATWMGAENRANELFSNADAKAALGDDLTAAQKKFATFKKLNDRKAGAAIAEQTESSVKEFEAFWADAKAKIIKSETPGDKDTAITDTDRKLEDIRKTVAALPQDADSTKAFKARVDKIGAEYTQLALADKVKEKATRLKDEFDSYKDEFAGWEQETAGPTFEEYRQTSGETMHALKAPKTEKFVSRSDYWLDNRKEDEDFKKLQSAPEIKAIYDKVIADRNTALAKMEKFADALLADMEKQTLDQNKVDKIKTFEDGLKNNIQGSSKLDAYTKRAHALVDKFENQGKAGEAAAAAYYKTMTEKAAAAWPDMKAKFTVTEGFDPNKPGDLKGKYIRITSRNRMGWDYNTGDFQYATTLNGTPIAGKYDPTVAAAVKEVESKMGRALGDSDDDGDWEVIALVEGSTGKLSKRVNVEGKISDTHGNTATVTGERAEVVDAPIVTIVAAHCGPLAVAAGAGSVKENGAVSAPAASTGASGGSLAAVGGTAGGSGAISSLLWLFGIAVGLIAGTLALAKAGFAPLVTTAGTIQQKIGQQNMEYIGAACAVWGVIGLLRGYIIFGLVVNAAIIASGLYASMDMLESKGILKPAMAAKLRPLGVPIGLGTIVVVLITLVTKGRLMII